MCPLPWQRDNADEASRCAPIPQAGARAPLPSCGDSHQGLPSLPNRAQAVGKELLRRSLHPLGCGWRRGAGWEPGGKLLGCPALGQMLTWQAGPVSGLPLCFIGHCVTLGQTPAICHPPGLPPRPQSCPWDVPTLAKCPQLSWPAPPLWTFVGTCLSLASLPAPLSSELAPPLGTCKHPAVTVESSGDSLQERHLQSPACYWPITVTPS